MDMDDPWGSPWADEVHLQHPAKQHEQDESHDPGPKTTIDNSRLTLRDNANAISPWNDADDDGFGDWAAVPVEEAEGNSKLDRKEGPWKHNEGERSVVTKYVSGSLSGPWLEASAIQDEHVSQLAPNPIPEHAVAPNSPDPWGSGFAVADGDGKEADQPKHRELDDDVGITPVVTSDFSEGTSPTVQGSPIQKEELEVDLEDFSREAPTSDETTILKTGSQATTVPAVPDLQDVDPSSSRPSSSPSDGSNHDEAPQESPRTSLDEDSKRPQVLRSASSKLQELVQHFDGLAKPGEEASDESTLSHRNSSHTIDQDEVEQDEEEEDESDDFGEFGDFEEGSSKEAEVDKEIEPTIILDTIPVREIRTPEPPSSPQVYSPQNRTPRKDFGPVDFEIDQLPIKEIFPSIEEIASEENIFISDTVPYDSFSTAEQRKLWYRVSRYGTMLKHNSGDDENYIRVSWPKSQIREGTLKTVARWMEEDRISGHVVLGGGSKTSSIFGWNDPKAAPVPLSTAFATRTLKRFPQVGPEPVAEIPREWPQGHARSLSLPKPQHPSKTRRRSSAKSVKSTDDAAIPPVASFGWNSSPGSTQESKAKMTEVIPPSISTSNAISRSAITPEAKNSPETKLSAIEATSPFRDSVVSSDAGSRGSHNPPIPVPKHSTQSHQLRIALTDLEKSDDDEWGDMVSSPAVTIPTIPPLPNGLGHKKSQSLGGSLLFRGPQQDLITAKQATIPIRPGHRSTMSLNGDFLPQNKSFDTSNIYPTQGPSVTNHTPRLSSNGCLDINEPFPLPSITASSDPWASADFSFFDSGPAPPPKAAPNLVPKSINPKSVKFATPSATESPRQIYKSREEQEQERIVQVVLKGLPNLSYMLRR